MRLHRPRPSRGVLAMTVTDSMAVPEMEEHARFIARTLKSGMPPGCGFVIVLFDYVAGGNMTYLSTGNRQDTVKLLRELCTKMEREPS
jgi:hypothetical protein